MEEWLLFHYVQGFRRFYLYNNESSDDWRSVVRPWVADGLVEAVDYPGTGVQQRIYDDCLTRARGKVRWLAFLDDDEFLFASDGANFRHRIEEYRHFAGVAIPWVLYGTAGRQNRSSEWVIERFQQASPCADLHVKCIVRPDRVLRSKLIGHAFVAKPGYEVVDEHKRPLFGELHPTPSSERLRINHYILKSWEEWRVRRSRPQADTGTVKQHTLEQWQSWDRDWSQKLDPSACQFVPAMRRLQEKRASRWSQWVRRSRSVLALA